MCFCLSIAIYRESRKSKKEESMAESGILKRMIGLEYIRYLLL